MSNPEREELRAPGLSEPISHCTDAVEFVGLSAVTMRSSGLRTMTRAFDVSAKRWHG
jgi:hypothetical protein